MVQASAEKLEHTGPTKKGWPYCHKVNSWQGRQSRFCQKEKEQSHLSRLSDREVKESQGEQERCTLARKRGPEREHGEERVDSTVKKGGLQEEKEGKQRLPP